jgi:lipopolysaccharide/colanic/teichoic acid biosynthesis glycosyltransferase
MYASDVYRHLARLDPILKRLIDMLAAAAGLILLSPLLVVISVAIKAYDGGPIFYRACRVGKDGWVFRLYKFRTMVVNADRQGPMVTTSGDMRITPLGRRLRRTKLDELPQLLNVLFGDMSLVGPRPEDPRYVTLYTQQQRRILSVRPGITSAASLVYRHEEQMLSGPQWESVYRNQVMPAKLGIDLNYLSKRTLWSDIGIILRTIAVMFE